MWQDLRLVRTKLTHPWLLCRYSSNLYVDVKMKTTTFAREGYLDEDEVEEQVLEKRFIGQAGPFQRGQSLPCLRQQQLHAFQLPCLAWPG